MSIRNPCSLIVILLLEISSDYLESRPKGKKLAKINGKKNLYLT